MSGRRVPIPPVHKRLLSLRWDHPGLGGDSNETTRRRKNLKNGFHQKGEVFAKSNNVGLTKEQVNFLVFRAGRGMPDGIFSGTGEDAVYFPDIAPRVEHFMEEDIRQIRCMLARGYRSYEVDKASAWKMLYYAELLLKGYTLRKLVIRGDFGVVYLATCDGANCKVRVAEEIAKDGATKVGIKIIDKSETRWYQVRNEIAAHATTSGHPNVLKLYQVFHTATAIYLVHELTDIRGSVASVIPRNGFTEDDCREMMRGMLQGLRHLQRLDVVHRNLTCANIFLTTHGTIKIAEFGLACVLPERDFLLHQKVGTCGYMAPEILRGLRYNGFQSDIWSIGIVLYFLLHKFLPFTDEDLMLYNCWHCLDFTHRSLSVELCLLLRSVLQFRPTARPSVEIILRHNWLAEDSRHRTKSQVKPSAVARSSVQPEPMNSILLDPLHSSSVKSVQEKEQQQQQQQQQQQLETQRKNLDRCWAKLMSSDGQNSERIALKSRIITHNQQDDITRLERKLKARNKVQRKITRTSSSLKTAVLPELGSTHSSKTKQPTGEPTDVPPTQVPSAPILPTSGVTEGPIDGGPLEPDPGDVGREKGVYCTSMRCIREIQQMRKLFETPSTGSPKSSLVIHIPSVSEDDEDNYDREGEEEEEEKKTDKEGESKMLTVKRSRDMDSESKAASEKDDRTTDEAVSGMVEHSDGKLTAEKSLSSEKDAAQIEGRQSDERQSLMSHSWNKEEAVASSHQMKEVHSEWRLIASIRNLRDSATSHSARSVSSRKSSLLRKSDESGANWARRSEFGLGYAAGPSLDALDEVPAEYATHLDVEDEAIERLIRTQYYNQLDLPSMADDPLEAETMSHRNDSNRSSMTLGSPQPSLLLSSTNPDAPLTYDTVGDWMKAIRSGSIGPSDSSSSLFHPELAINWDMIGDVYAGSDHAELTPLKETRTKSRTTVVSRAPSLRGITEELHAAAIGGEAKAVGSGRLPEKNQTQENLRKANSLGKRTADSFPGKARSKDRLQSSSSSSLGRLQAQSQIQIQEEKSENAVWESISTRGISKGSYPKLAASVAGETSLHSIVELRSEREAEQLEPDD